MEEPLYHALRLLGAPFRFRVMGMEHVRTGGPAVYVANHCGNLGPVVIVLSVPLRFYPWVKADLLDPRRSPAHLYREFGQRTLHLSPGPGMALMRVISWITVPLLRAIGCIPVESQGFYTSDAFRRSLGLLMQGANVLIFPEDALRPLDEETMLHPFNMGFVQLCRLYRRMALADLPLYPVAVSPPARAIAIGEPQFYREDGDGHWRERIQEFGAHIQAEVGRMIRALER